MAKAEYDTAGKLKCQWPKWVTDELQAAVVGKCSLNVRFNFPQGVAQNVDFILVGTTTRAPTTIPEPTSESTAYEIFGTATIREVPQTTTPKAGGLKTWVVVVIVISGVIALAGCFALVGFVLWKCGILNRILGRKGKKKELNPTDRPPSDPLSGSSGGHPPDTAIGSPAGTGSSPETLVANP